MALRYSGVVPSRRKILTNGMRPPQTGISSRN
jgi:hypothetical protein